MTIEDSDVPAGSAPRTQPARSARRSGARPFGIIIVAAAVAVAALAGLSAVADYALRDRTASSPAPPTMTVTASSKALGGAGGADSVFLSALAGYNIPDHGEAARQRFMELGHHVCFSLLPPRAQSLESTVNNILVLENQDVGKGDPWAQRFSLEDAENLAQAAIKAYCPNALK
jgi:multidrug efflux pump subunit AcrA (membrane-fusion protein)